MHKEFLHNVEEENLGKMCRKKYQKISSSLIFPNFRENCRDSEYFQWRHKNASEMSDFSNAHFRNIPENLSHIFDANRTHFLPEWKIYVPSEKIMEKFSEFFAEIPGGDRT